MALDAGYPPARGRARAGGLPLAEVYERLQSVPEVASADAEAVLVTFAGRPDSITLTARTAGVAFRLTDRLNRELDEFVVPAGTSLDTHTRAERVFMRSATAAAAGLASCVGKWAARAERGSGYDE